MPQLLAVLILAALTVLIFAAMRRGWLKRGRSLVIQDLPTLPPGSALAKSQGIGGVYVSTTLAGQPFERVVTLGLGTRSGVRVHVDEAGVLLARTGARDLFIPAATLTDVSTTGGMIGKVARSNSIIVLTWASDETALDTGVHIRSESDRHRLLSNLSALASATARATGPDASQNG